MKLLAKYNRIYLTASIIVFLITGVGYYFVVNYVLIHQLDRALKEELNEIKTYVQQHHTLLPQANTKNQFIFYNPTTKEISKARFSYVSAFVKEENEVIQFRQLTAVIAVNSEHVEVIIREPKTETDDLLQLIFLATFVIASFFVLLLFIINRFLLQKVWRPFHHLLGQIQQFNLSNKNQIVPQETDISEFESLNKALVDMSGKVNQEFHSLKDFTENASHEMQTPLAILNARLDLMIQKEELTETEIGQLQEMYGAVNRLTRLNKSLLLLTKIENRQFSEADTIELDRLILEKIGQMNELIKSKHLQVETNIQPLALKMNPHLADTVINNLISNAIHHNHEKGSIFIQLDPEALTISNTGPEIQIDASKIFERFQKNQKSEGLGLGLAIIKQICDQYRFEIAYSNVENRHLFKIKF